MSESNLPRVHHPTSPSQLSYLEFCPSYVGESGDSEAALAGTAQHEAVEAGGDEHDEASLSDAQAEAVALCKAYREQLIARFPGGKVLQEVYLPIDGRKIEVAGTVFTGTTAGYVDVAVVSADEKSAAIADWKFGAHSVEPAETNPQGIAYLLGLLKMFPHLETVEVSFVLPHREEIDVHTFRASEFAALRLRIETIAGRALAARQSGDFSQARTGTPTCLFCSQKSKCPKLAEAALIVGKKFQPLMFPGDVNPTTFNDVTQATFTMRFAQVMEGWAKAMRRQITERSIDQDAWLPEGYILRQRANREIVNEARIIEMARSRGLTEAQIEASRKLSMTPLNAAIRDGAARGSKKTAEQDFRDALIADGCLEEAPPTIFLEMLKS